MCVHAKKKETGSHAQLRLLVALSLSLLKALNHDNSPPPSWWLVVRADWEGEGWNASISALPPSSFVPPPFFAIAKPPGVCAHFPDQKKMQNRPIMPGLQFTSTKSCHDTMKIRQPEWLSGRASDF